MTLDSLSTVASNIAAASQPPKAPGVPPGAAPMMLGSPAPGPILLAGVEPHATVPISHLRLLVNGIRQIRQSVESLTVQLPVLSAAEISLQQPLNAATGGRTAARGAP